MTDAETAVGVIQMGTSLVAADAVPVPVSNAPDDAVSVARHGCADTEHVTAAPPTPWTVVGVLPPFCCWRATRRPNWSPPREHLMVPVTIADPVVPTVAVGSMVIVTAVKSVNSNAPTSHWPSRGTKR